MRARTYGLLLLALVGILPLAVFGYLALQRSESTAIDLARTSNQRLAVAVADRIAAYMTAERQLLATMGAAALQAKSRDDAKALLGAYELSHQHFHDVTVYRRDGSAWVGNPTGEFARLATSAAAGERDSSRVKPAAKNATGAFAHTMVIAEPVMVAGRREGAIVATVDLVGIWPPINSTRVGKSGFVRLLTADGQLLAHGDPEERRFVFDADAGANRAFIAAAQNKSIVTNQQGKRVVASVAKVPNSNWVVLVEQSVGEAFAGAAAIRRDLVILGLLAVVVIILLGVVFGRFLVRGLERLRAHTNTLASGDLEARVDPKSRLLEVRALADSLNEMSESLHQLHEEARARERVTTFGRIAAGLAHDLRRPIEALRSACEMVTRAPDDPEAIALLQSVNEKDLPRLKEYMDDLRHLAQSGDMDLRRQRTDPGALVQEVVAELATKPKWAGVEFSATGECDDTFWDRRLIHRALFNLAANGAEAILEGRRSGMVTIALAPPREDELVQIRVSDNGVGIPQDRLGEILSVDFVSTKRTSGIGLGLGVVRQVADAHEGRVEVSSRPGHGTVFTLTLPGNDPSIEEGVSRDC